MIFIHDDCSVWKEGLCKFGVGAPHIADEELYLQAFFPGNVPPIISQMALGPIWENVEDPTLFRINQNALRQWKALVEAGQAEDSKSCPEGGRPSGRKHR